MSEKRKLVLSITFGAFARPMRSQLKGRGIDRETMKHFQADADALTRLVVRGLLNDSEALRARKRFVDRIAEKVTRP